jgi:hypothetical protein
MSSDPAIPLHGISLREVKNVSSYKNLISIADLVISKNWKQFKCFSTSKSIQRSTIHQRKRNY